ncbi:hypothetical protein ATANTOWER_023054 [Ataeniobius toweri]|uniref:Uncharacterized protein n=1 Tax=Ataeniobius toweri TaxID=208326 RepID=A0ABU7B0E9_9TELE|nr:hypothetical protein [Ataeniobius toweri]
MASRKQLLLSFNYPPLSPAYPPSIDLQKQAVFQRVPSRDPVSPCGAVFPGLKEGQRGCSTVATAVTCSSTRARPNCTLAKLSHSYGGAGSFQVRTCGPITSQRGCGRSVKCGRQMCPSFARFEGWVVSILRGPSFPMIHCGSKRFGQAGAAMADHSGKSWTKEQTGQFIKLRGENDHLFTGAKNSATVAWRYNNNILCSQFLSSFKNSYLSNFHKYPSSD